MNKFNEISENLEVMISYARQCEIRLAKGEAVDLSGLDEKTEDICAEIIALPRDQGQELGAKLADFIKILDRISDSLQNPPA